MIKSVVFGNRIAVLFAALLVVFLPGFTNLLPAATVNGDTVVLVNSSSPKFLDFQHYVQPYLDYFGVSYAVLDISSNSVGTNIGDYAEIIIGHSQLDTNNVFLSAAEQTNLTLAVSNGTGLVNFDSALATTNGTPRYQFIQNIFGFTYGTATNGLNVTFPATEPGPSLHFITKLHATNETVLLSNSMSLAGITFPTNVSMIALSSGKPLLGVKKFGQGRAVQWTSYDWISVNVKGPVGGLDDLIWREFIWAARKPYVMRGMPNFLTFRIDDVAGPLDWAHTAIQMGFKPWMGLFFSCFSNSAVVDLRSMITNGDVTASIHSFGCISTGGGLEWLYYNHFGKTNWSDSVQSNSFALATAWLTSNQIPSSKVVCAHYSEFGPNAFAGLKAWGIEYFPIELVCGAALADNPPWLKAGPYRYYETPGLAAGNQPFMYADFLTVPGHPEFDGQFFNCYSWIKDLSSCNEWCPDNNVASTVNRGVAQMKRSFDSLALATLFTHEFYIHPTQDVPGNPAITTSNWVAILQGLTNGLAAYKPEFVTLDYACQYVRARKTSTLLSSSYDTSSGLVSSTLSGKTDLATRVFIYTGEDSAITNLAGTLPVFTNGITQAVALLLPPVISVVQTQADSVTLAWPSPAPGFILENCPALNLGGWTPVTNQPQLTNNQFQVIVPNGGTSGFYRLERQ